MRAPAERRGLTAEVAKEGLDAVRDLARANNRQSRLMAAVHDLSEERQIAREAVLEWASDFHFYVQRALDGDDQLREQFDQHVP